MPLFNTWISEFNWILFDFQKFLCIYSFENNKFLIAQPSMVYFCYVVWIDLEFFLYSFLYLFLLLKYTY